MSFVPVGSRNTGRGTALISLRLTSGFLIHYELRGLTIHNISHYACCSVNGFLAFDKRFPQGSSYSCMQFHCINTYIQMFASEWNFYSLRMFDIIIYIHVLTEL